MRMTNRNTGKVDYSQQEYHRLMFNHFCNSNSSPFNLYKFERPTGLKDRNKKELFEGDTFRFYKHKGYILPDFTATVVWIPEYACFGYQKDSDKGTHKPTPFSTHHELQYDFLNYIEIIGNLTYFQN